MDKFKERCLELIQQYYEEEFGETDSCVADSTGHVGLLYTTFLDSKGKEHDIQIDASIDFRTITYYFDCDDGVVYRYTAEEFLEQMETLNWDDMQFDAEEYYINNLEVA